MVFYGILFQLDDQREDLYIMAHTHLSQILKRQTHVYFKGLQKDRPYIKTLTNIKLKTLKENQHNYNVNQFFENTHTSGEKNCT
jgi:hypothetical protein